MNLNNIEQKSNKIKHYMEISKGDKELIIMTGKFLAGKGYHKAEVAILLLDNMKLTRKEKDLK